MLIDILKNIFSEFSYLSKDFNIQDYQVTLFYQEEIDNYFIVLDKNIITVDELQNLNDISIQLFNLIKEDDLTNESFDKNATLIICFNGNVDNNIICNLEENPYLFKKNILKYNSEEIESLNTLLNSNYSYENLLLFLNNEEQFEEYKNNSELAYSLLTKFFIKLPFLKFIRQTRDLANLTEIISNKVSEEDLTEIYNLINYGNFDVQNINSYEDLISNNFIEGNTNE